MNEDQASTVIRKIFDECVDDFTSMQLSQDLTDFESDLTENSSDVSKSQTLSQIKEAFDDLMQKIESEGLAAEKSSPILAF